MSRISNSINGFAADILGQFLTTILTFIATPILLLFLSKDNYGLWLTIGSIMVWIAISDIGIGIALSRQLIKIRNNQNKLHKIYGRTFFTMRRNDQYHCFVHLKKIIILRYL